MVGRRKYESGMANCAWRWSDVVLDGALYLRRLHLVKVQLGRFGFALMLHWIFRPDPQPDLHDHPVSFLALVLRGGYLEKRARGLRTPGEGVYHVVRWFNILRTTDRHRILALARGGPTVTLCFAGPKKREWGFHTPSGWVDWRTYSAPRRTR